MKESPPMSTVCLNENCTGKGAKKRTNSRIRSSLLAILSSCISCTLLSTLKFAYKSICVIFDEGFPYRVIKFFV